MTDDLSSVRAIGALNTGFLLEKEGASCGPLQQLRELTQNGIEAVLARGGAGSVAWCAHTPPGNTGARKLSVVDDGTGLTGAEMVHYFGNLAASGRNQARDANFGMGAKIALYFHNPEGIIWRSWRGRQGAEVQVRRMPGDAGGVPVYGLVQHRHPDGDGAAWRAIGDELRPQLLADGRNGTQVILLGRDTAHDTTRPPLARTVGRRGWIRYYLNTRYFELPREVTVVVCEGAPSSEARSAIRGQRSYLDEQAEKAGTVELDAARAHWWLLRAQPKRGRQSPLWASSGHLAVLYRGELFAMLDSTEGGYATLQNSFGLRLGYERVVIYLEPRQDAVEVDIKRTHLLVDGAEPAWDRWGREFQASLPDALRGLQADLSHAPESRKSIRSRLEQHAAIFQVSAYRRPRGPVGGTDHDRRARGDRVASEIAHDAPALGYDVMADRSLPMPGRRSARQPAPTCRAQTRQPPTPREAGARRSPPAIELPTVRWVAIAEGTRAAGELEDLAARYDQRADLLTINGDFRLITDMVRRWQATFARGSAERQLVLLAVQESFEQALIEAVLTARALEGTSQAWPAPGRGDGPESRILTPQALTIAVFSRQLMDVAIKKRLAQRLGRPQRPPLT
ncbi:hypothetical protein Q5424_01025 [Conexibacter sp. JD483]|uniref:hypothetical protein n=1 Tax=unclassified Conexibacter TaxID=2627773 RepID=UPI002727A2D3|nr:MULTISPECIES: hypothetical protein [unclassified Conexibacter]MDO8185810.1 hypothetical protein [Conexibacter sp. CPCC 205706]MDO8198554.1 hypothetical protein [Conexibacter sp. CPCC 205762]MDR9367640.1 hypothetical protein [Conexibacter sp. JD483]